MMSDYTYYYPQYPQNGYPTQVQVPYYHHQAHVDVSSSYWFDHHAVHQPSSSRLQRNQAEKLRRDKLNQFINELAILVPMVASSAKKLDKTSVLRLSATFLRMHHTLVGKTESMRDLAIPVEWGRTLLDGLQAILLVVTSTRKIVYISENVERILGHHQNDLLGSDLKEITHKDDELALNENLEPRGDGDITTMGTRRCFFLRLAHRPATRSDQPQYEKVRVEGHLRISKHHPQAPQNRSKTHVFERYVRNHLSLSNGNGYGDSKGESGMNSNDVVLVALVRPFEMQVTDNSLLEASKEEWLSRHLLDGTIVYADHRISVLSGYMSEEVHGSSAFQYMHRHDARWVMIALRQMFCTSESMGWSCYRLKAKNGEYIYLRTQGYLEVNNNVTQGNVQSFICINNLVSREEGERLLNEMKTAFTPLIKKKANPLALAGRNDLHVNINANKREVPPIEDVALQPLETENSEELKSAIGQLLVGLDQVCARPPSPNKRDQDYAKVEIVSKALPPVEVQRGHIGAKLPVLQGKYNRPSVITSITGSSERAKRPPELVIEPECETKRMRAESRSVIVSETRSVIKRNDPELETSFLSNSTDLNLLPLMNTSFSDEGPLELGPEDITSLEYAKIPVSVLNEDVLHRHSVLQKRLQSQEVQIQEIGEEIQTVAPLTNDLNMIRRFNELKAEHFNQEELYKSLQHDHQNIHQANEQLLRGAEQDIGA